MNPKYKCTICKKSKSGFGNNAEPVVIGKCCDECYSKVIIPKKLKRIKKQKRTWQIQ